MANPKSKALIWYSIICESYVKWILRGFPSDYMCHILYVSFSFGDFWYTVCIGHYFRLADFSHLFPPSIFLHWFKISVIFLSCSWGFFPLLMTLLESGPFVFFSSSVTFVFLFFWNLFKYYCYAIFFAFSKFHLNLGISK